jgi:hypothetical protein
MYGQGHDGSVLCSFFVGAAIPVSDLCVKNVHSVSSSSSSSLTTKEPGLGSALGFHLLDVPAVHFAANDGSVAEREVMIHVSNVISPGRAAIQRATHKCRPGLVPNRDGPIWTNPG